MHSQEIPSKDRRYLRHLSLTPLVIVDTNILVDAFHHRLSERLELMNDSSLGLNGDRTFHRILLSKAREGRINLWIPQIVRKELLTLTSDLNRVRNFFDEILVDRKQLDELLKQDEIIAISEQVIAEFSTWAPLDLRLEEESCNDEIVESLEEFLSEHSEVFEELSAHKNISGVSLRSEIDGVRIYPESSDLGIMRICMTLASKPLHEIGVVLVATRDGDFTLVARALEERFGFGIVNHGRKLMSWLN
jgi:hypothetical protein